MKNYSEETASQYDALRAGHQMERKFEIIKSFIKKTTKGEKKLSVGDIGHGSGQLCSMLADYFKNYEIEGFEVNPGFVEYAKKKFENNNLHFSLLDIEKSKLPKKFNVLITIDVLHHLKNVSKSVKNIERSLEKEGIWVAIEPNIYNLYIFFFQLFAQNEKLFYQKKTEKMFNNFSEILEKRYSFFIPFWIKNPPEWMKKIELNWENNKIMGGSAIYLLKKT